MWNSFDYNFDKSRAINKSGPVSEGQNKLDPSEAQWARTPEAVEGGLEELPFEFQVLEIV